MKESYDYQNAMIAFTDYGMGSFPLGTYWKDYFKKSLSDGTVDNEIVLLFGEDGFTMYPKPNNEAFNNFMHLCTGKQVMSIVDCAIFISKFLKDLGIEYDTDYSVNFKNFSIKSSEIVKVFKILAGRAILPFYVNFLNVLIEEDVTEIVIPNNINDVSLYDTKSKFLLTFILKNKSQSVFISNALGNIQVMYS